MTYDEKVILATVDSMLIWDYIKEHGCGKLTAIRDLMASETLCRTIEFPLNLCPLCQRFSVYVDDDTHEAISDCRKCPWPGSGEGRCELDDESPYSSWRYVSGPLSRSKIADNVFELLSTMPLQGD